MPVDSTLPQVPFEELEELYLDESDPLLLAQSFLLTGNEEEITEYVFKGGLPMAEVQGYDNSVLDELEVEASPTEPCPPGYGWFLVDNNNPTPANPHEFVWVCMSLNPPPPTNACGCPLPSNTRYPSGCLQVDYDGGWEPVERAMVVVRDGWFKSDMTYATREGCWSMNRRYSGRKIAIRVIFKNENVRARNPGFFNSLRAVRDYAGTFGTPPYDRLLQYGSGITNNTSTARQYWAAAHTLNTVSQYRSKAVAEGIPLPRTGLNWTNHAGVGAAAAPMLQGQVYNSWLAYLAVFLAGPIYQHLIVDQLPDIVNRYAPNESASDFNSVGFHELAHASHYSSVGENYWVPYRNRIINNGGYGTLGSFSFLGSSPELIALGEAVGFYMEVECTNQGAVLTGPIKLGSERSTFLNNFIPVGLMWDLTDSRADTVADVNNSTTIIDNISGFTPSMLFDALNANVRSIRDFRDELRSQHLGNTSNSAADFDSFVDFYDVL